MSKETKFLVGETDEIIITVPQKAKPEADAPTNFRRKGMILPHRFDDFLPRRFKAGSGPVDPPDPPVIPPPVFFFKFFDEAGIYYGALFNPYVAAHTDYFATGAAFDIKSSVPSLRPKKRQVEMRGMFRDVTGGFYEAVYAVEFDRDAYFEHEIPFDTYIYRMDGDRQIEGWNPAFPSYLRQWTNGGANTLRARDSVNGSDYSAWTTITVNYPGKRTEY